MPERCINVKGLVVKSKTEEWVVTWQKTNPIVRKKFDIAIDLHTKKLNAKITYGGIGNESYKLRTVYQPKPENIAKYLDKRYKIDVTDIEQIQDKGVDKPFRSRSITPIR